MREGMRHLLLFAIHYDVLCIYFANSTFCCGHWCQLVPTNATLCCFSKDIEIPPQGKQNHIFVFWATDISTQIKFRGKKREKKGKSQ